MKQGTYTIEIYCYNCHTTWNEDVPKGKTASGFFTCPYCGCDEGKNQGRAGDTGLVISNKTL